MILKINRYNHKGYFDYATIRDFYVFRLEGEKIMYSAFLDKIWVDTLS